MIKLKSFVDNAASKTNGLKLKIRLDSALYKKENISVDFQGINKYAFPFFNHSFVLLAILYGFEVIEQIKFLNISEDGKLVYEESMKNAKFISELDEKQERDVESIVNSAFKEDA